MFPICFHAFPCAAELRSGGCRWSGAERQTASALPVPCHWWRCTWCENLKPPVCLAFWPKKYLVWQFLGTMARTNVRFSAVDKPYIWQRLSTQAFWLAASFWSCVIFRARATVPPTEKGLLLGISFVPIIFRSVGWLKCHRKMPTSMYGWSKKLGPCSCHLFPKKRTPLKHLKTKTM